MGEVTALLVCDAEIIWDGVADVDGKTLIELNAFFGEEVAFGLRNMLLLSLSLGEMSEASDCWEVAGLLTGPEAAFDWDLAALLAVIADSWAGELDGGSRFCKALHCLDGILQVTAIFPVVLRGLLKGRLAVLGLSDSEDVEEIWPDECDLLAFWFSGVCTGEGCTDWAGVAGVAGQERFVEAIEVSTASATDDAFGNVSEDDSESKSAFILIAKLSLLASRLGCELGTSSTKIISSSSSSSLSPFVKSICPPFFVLSFKDFVGAGEGRGANLPLVGLRLRNLRLVGSASIISTSSLSSESDSNLTIVVVSGGGMLCFFAIKAFLVSVVVLVAVDVVGREKAEFPAEFTFKRFKAEFIPLSGRTLLLGCWAEIWGGTLQFEPSSLLSLLASSSMEAKLTFLAVPDWLKAGCWLRAFSCLRMEGWHLPPLLLEE